MVGDGAGDTVRAVACIIRVASYQRATTGATVSTPVSTSVAGAVLAAAVAVWLKYNGVLVNHRYWQAAAPAGVVTQLGTVDAVTTMAA